MKTAEEIRKLTGGYISATPLQDIPGTRAAFDELLARVQALPFVPQDWRANVNAAMDDAGGSFLWQPAPAIRIDAWRADKTEPTYPDTPSWIVNNADARVAWNTLDEWWSARMQPILAGWARSGAEVVAAANADAVFWNTLYTIVKPVAAVGQTIIDAPGAAADVVNKMGWDVLKKALPIIAVVGLIAVAVLIYKNKMVGK